MKKFFVALVLCLITIFYGTEAFSLDGMNIGEQLHDISKDVMKNQGYSDDAIEFIMDKESWKKYGISKDDSKKSLEDLWDEGKIPSRIKEDVRKYLLEQYQRDCSSVFAAVGNFFEGLGLSLKEAIVFPVKDGYLRWMGDPDYQYLDKEAREISLWNEAIFDRENSRLKNVGYVRIPTNELLAIIDEEDLAFVQSQNEELYAIDMGKSTEGEAAKYTGGTKGGYSSVMKDITLEENFYKGTNVSNEGKKFTFHHETQHAKDFAAMKKAGYSGVFLADILQNKDKNDNSKRIDKMSALLWQAIIEARAYSEAAVYTYAKMKTAKYQGNKEEEERWKKVYESGDDYGLIGFKKAIEDHKTVEEARHIAAVTLLNSCQFIGGYMSERAKRNYPGTFHISPEKMIGILRNYDGGKDKVTLEDLYSANAFWTRLCSYDETKNTDECKRAGMRIKSLKEDIEYSKSIEARKGFRNENCNEVIEEGVCDKFKGMIAKYINVPGPDDENFDADEVFRKMDKVFAVDKTCASEACEGKKRILTTEEDEDYYKRKKYAYRVCCSLDFDMGSACSACGICDSKVFLKPKE